MDQAKILIAEDEQTQREILEGFLKKEGFSVTGTANGREALQRLDEEYFDIVLLDYKMPELDGLQTLREIRRLNPDLPVIMMTAYGTVETAVASMKEGALDYITKPIDLDELLLNLQKGIGTVDPDPGKQSLEGSSFRNVPASTTSSMEAPR